MAENADISAKKCGEGVDDEAEKGNSEEAVKPDAVSAEKNEEEGGKEIGETTTDGEQDGGKSFEIGRSSAVDKEDNLINDGQEGQLENLPNDSKEGEELAEEVFAEETEDEKASEEQMATLQKDSATVSNEGGKVVGECHTSQDAHQDAANVKGSQSVTIRVLNDYKDLASIHPVPNGQWFEVGDETTEKYKELMKQHAAEFSFEGVTGLGGKVIIFDCALADLDDGSHEGGLSYSGTVISFAKYKEDCFYFVILDKGQGLRQEDQQGWYHYTQVYKRRAERKFPQTVVGSSVRNAIGKREVANCTVHAKNGTVYDIITVDGFTKTVLCGKKEGDIIRPNSMLWLSYTDVADLINDKGKSIISSRNRSSATGGPMEMEEEEVKGSKKRHVRTSEKTNEDEQGTVEQPKKKKKKKNISTSGKGGKGHGTVGKKFSKQGPAVRKTVADIVAKMGSTLPGKETAEQFATAATESVHIMTNAGTMVTNELPLNGMDGSNSGALPQSSRGVSRGEGQLNNMSREEIITSLNTHSAKVMEGRTADADTMKEALHELSISLQNLKEAVNCSTITDMRLLADFERAPMETAWDKFQKLCCVMFGGKAKAAPLVKKAEEMWYSSNLAFRRSSILTDGEDMATLDATVSRATVAKGPAVVSNEDRLDGLHATGVTVKSYFRPTAEQQNFFGDVYATGLQKLQHHDAGEEDKSPVATDKSPVATDKSPVATDKGQYAIFQKPIEETPEDKGPAVSSAVQHSKVKRKGEANRTASRGGATTPQTAIARGQPAWNGLFPEEETAGLQVDVEHNVNDTGATVWNYTLSDGDLRSIVVYPGVPQLTDAMQTMAIADAEREERKRKKKVRSKTGSSRDDDGAMVQLFYRTMRTYFKSMLRSCFSNAEGEVYLVGRDSQVIFDSKAYLKSVCKEANKGREVSNYLLKSDWPEPISSILKRAYQEFDLADTLQDSAQTHKIAGIMHESFLRFNRDRRYGCTSSKSHKTSGPQEESSLDEQDEQGGKCVNI